MDGNVLPEYVGNRTRISKRQFSYEDIASKFFEHFLYIADAIDGIGEAELGLWDETDGFYKEPLFFSCSAIYLAY